MRSTQAIRDEIRELHERVATNAARGQQIETEIPDLQAKIASLHDERQQLDAASALATDEIHALERALAVLEDHTPEPQPEPEIAPEPTPDPVPPTPTDTDSVDEERARVRRELDEARKARHEAQATGAKQTVRERVERETHETPNTVRRAPGQTRIPITEGEDRDGRTVLPDDLDLVREIVEEYAPISQIKIAHLLVDLLAIKPGTAQAITSGALLKLRVAEVVSWTGEKDDGSRVWIINQEARA